MRVVSTHPSDLRHTNALKAALHDIEAPGWAVVFGDRREMLEAALALHYDGVKLVHVGGGDVAHGEGAHPDHCTRDALTMLASVHCVSNERARYCLMGILPHSIVERSVHVTGSPGLDEVVAYAKTLDPNRKRDGVFEWFPEHLHTWVPTTTERLSPQDFLHKLAHCERFITNSSAGLYEAPILGTPVELVGDRQAGRRGPYHAPNGDACQQIRKVIEDVCVRR